MSTLVIVESPTKARTIKGFLPKGYRVLASMGHIRDLPKSAAEIPAKYKKEPWAQLGVNVTANFEPLYVTPKDKKATLSELKKSLKEATEIILATDEDREGESISWHLLQTLKPKVPVKRIVFHEITKDAIEHALKHYREIDSNLVHAQETRRVLDRLVGYSLSPLLWKKIAIGLSAGRVQSVSVRLLVIRERERRVFKSGTYWDLKAELEINHQTFESKLVEFKNQKIATGKDFDETTGKIAKGRSVYLLQEREARELKEQLSLDEWKVTSVEEKPVKKTPAPPFITSSLQQEANRKLRLSARDAMRIAQGLYERGLITYMRTDSVNLSDEAITAARNCVTKMYGKEYLSSKPRTFKTKTKGAQEAHEAIRPSGKEFVLPKDTDLQGKELALYELIWKRTVACQMAEAKQTNMNARIQVGEAVFRSYGKRIDFPGFFRAYVEGSDDPNVALENQEVYLPQLKEGDIPFCKKLDTLSHETLPPARFTEAALVKRLEQEGVGRPSTYATIIGTIMDRGYVEKINDALVPTFTAFAVTSLLEKHFSNLVNLDFTSSMEETLDYIASGEQEYLPYLKNFFLGEKGLDIQVKNKTDEIPPGEFRRIQFQDLDAKVCIGKFGPYIELGKDENKVTASIPKDIMPADLTKDKVEQILDQKSKWNDELGIDENTGKPVYLLNGTYGPYVQLGEIVEGEPKPKRVSLPKDLKESEVTFEIALKLLGLPRLLGEHPEGKGKIYVNIGRFGPYVVLEDKENGKDYRSLKKEDSLLDIELKRALELLLIPKRGRGVKAPPLRDIGVHPEDQQPVQIYSGPYGNYIKHGKTNAGLPKNQDIQSVTLEQAIKLIAEKKSTKLKKRAK